jgi:hypothetical protein
MKLYITLFLVSLSFATFTLDWEDNFNDLSNWDVIDESGKATGNDEWEYYTSRDANVTIG